jgi:hypothetical protein
MLTVSLVLVAVNLQQNVDVEQKSFEKFEA